MKHRRALDLMTVHAWDPSAGPLTKWWRAYSIFGNKVRPSDEKYFPEIDQALMARKKIICFSTEIGIEDVNALASLPGSRFDRVTRFSRDSPVQQIFSSNNLQMFFFNFVYLPNKCIMQTIRWNHQGPAVSMQGRKLSSAVMSLWRPMYFQSSTIMSKIRLKIVTLNSLHFSLQLMIEL